jgi:hypothetical protein
MDHGTRAWEPGDFFEFPNVDPPLETIEPGLHCLLFGPAAAETRTLLMQRALAHARKDLDARVLYVCDRDACENAPPLLPRVCADAEPASRVHMKYVSTDAELRKLASSLHLLPPSELPSLLIVDDFGGFFPGVRWTSNNAPGEGGGGYGGYGGGGGAHQHMNPHERREREMTAARTHASLRACADAVVRPGGGAETSTCALLVSETTDKDGECPSMMYLFRRWFQCVVVATGVGVGGGTGGGAGPGGGGDDGNTFTLRRWPIRRGRANDDGGVRYVVDKAGAALVPDGYA